MSDSVAASTLAAGRDAYARHGWSEAFERAYRLLLAYRETGQEAFTAEQFVVSPQTVHRHLANIRNKLGQPTRAATVAHTAKLGLL